MTDATTLLTLSGDGIAPYSARGLTQSLKPIAASQNMRRTINGDLLDTASAQFRKYESTISCTDQQAPALDGIWPGMTLTVGCAAELCYKTGGTAERTPVSGSSRTDGDFTFYRPSLTMRVRDFQESLDEWNAQTGWTLELEEV
jgi:hypothetical protein